MSVWRTFLSAHLILLLQDRRLLVDVYGRMSSVDDVGSLLGGAVRRLRLRLVDWSLGGGRTVVGLLGWRGLVARLNGGRQIRKHLEFTD